MFLEIEGKPLLPLEAGEIYLIGKRISGFEKKCVNLIQLDHQENLDEKHCIIEINHKEEAFVFDLLSSRGTLLNNKSLNSLKRTSLKNGDILKLGTQEIKYFHNRNELSHDSSGFLENKNTSDIIDSSPDASQQSRIKRVNITNFLVPSTPPKKSITPNKSSSVLETECNTSKDSLNVSSALLNNRKSDSFTIPETQYCRPVNSLNDSHLSRNESINESEAGKINFNFGNADSFHDDGEFCIPETQDILPNDSVSKSQRTRSLSDVYNDIKKNSSLEKGTSTLKDKSNVENSQFRINTQDYNEGFGEEESVDDLHSQIIPLIKHQTIILNSPTNRSNDDSGKQSKEQEDKEMSALNWSNSKADLKAIELRADSSTPDIFDFDSIEAFMKTNHGNEKEHHIIDKESIEQEINMLDEDEEDFMPTQVFPVPTTKNVDKNSLKELEKPCLEKEHEEVLTLSDKENRCPVVVNTIADMPPTQLLEVPTVHSLTSVPYRSIVSSSIKPNDTPKVQNDGTIKSLLNIDSDEEDDLLTQAFLQPQNLPTGTNSTSSENAQIKCFNSTLVGDKSVAANISAMSDEIEKTSLKQIASPSTVFKKPEIDISLLKKTSSAISETDIDLLMCTPQLIKDNIYVKEGEDLKKNILAVKNKNLFGDETDEEGDEDQGDLVKLVNIPKDSLDFDKLLPHLNKRPARSKLNAKQKADKEAQKIHKFNISFGREHEEKQVKAATSKTSSLSRDERHMARDNEKEMTERKSRTEKKHKRSPSRSINKEILDRREGANTKEISSESRSNKKKAKQAAVPITEKLEEKASDKEKSSRVRKKLTSSEKTEKTKESEVVEKPSDREKSKRLRKKIDTTENTEIAKESESKQTPAKRMTRSRSRFEETSSTSNEGNKSKIMQHKEDDLDDIATQRISRVTSSRSSSRKNESQDSIKSNNSSHTKIKSRNNNLLQDSVTADPKTATKKIVERKRKSDAPTAAVPAKVVRKRHSQDGKTKLLTSDPVTISMTMVDQQLFKNLITKSKGIWNIANNPADCDILVMDKAFRTFKFLLAMARGVPIVTSDYLNKLNETQTKEAVRLSDYLFMDTEFETKFKFSLVNSLQAAKKYKIFKGYEFVMTASILPNPKEIKAIIEASGGCVHDKNPPQPKQNQKLYLVTTKEDKKEWHKYRRLNKNIVIVSTEAIMTAVMRQNSEVMIKYTLA